MVKDDIIDLTFGLTDEEITERFKKAIELENEEKRIMGIPIPVYDEEKKVVYLEYADGRREAVCRKESR